MKYIILSISFFLRIISFSQQVDKPVEVTEEMQEKIKRDINKDAVKFKQNLDKSGYSSAYKEFALDTFKIERFMSKWIDLDYRDFGMRDASYEGARFYDSLLNKYYKRLLALLKGNDKKILVQAQKAWLTFRDSETKLVYIISKPEYSGGGTMQQLTESSSYLAIIKNRTYDLFEHFVRASKSE